MKWEPIENAISYTIVINDEDLATVGSDTLEYRVEGLATGTAVSVKIKAQNTSGASEISEQVIVQLLPAAPLLVASDVSSYSVTLQWSVANGATYYKIYLDKEWCIYNVPSSINEVVITENISEGMTATYTIKAGNGTGESSHSQPVMVTFIGSETMLLDNSVSDSLPGLLYNKNVRLNSSLRGQPLVSIYFPRELNGPELALEATYLDRLAIDNRLKKVRFYAIFTNKVARFGRRKNGNIIWKRANPQDSRFLLPGLLPLVRFYDSEGWLVRQQRVSIPVLTFEDVLKELPEAIEVDDGMIELYRDKQDRFENLHLNSTN
jgi:hypothetical protein